MKKKVPGEISIVMIDNKSNFVCPIHHTELEWPEAYCSACKQGYFLTSVETSISNNEPIAIYDFRGNDINIEKDRKGLHAHLRILEGLYYFEDEMLKKLNFSYEVNNICCENKDKDIKDRLKSYFTYCKLTLRNISDLGKFFLFKENSRKLKASDSISSSFSGYSKSYEMISSFLRPTWLGFHNRRLVLDGFIQHHYYNMRILRGVIDKWAGREVLEFGVGSGVNLLLLKKSLPGGNELKLSGFDYAVARLLTAKAAFSKHCIEYEDLFLANGLNLPLRDNSYDVVFSHYVVEQMKGFESQALDNMIRVARKGVVLFETAVYHPTIDQRIYMKHSGYSRDLPKIVRRRKDVEVLEVRNIKESRIFGCPNVLFVLKKRQR